MLQMRKPRLRRSSSLRLPSHEVTEQGFAAGLSGLTPRLHSLRLENPRSQPRLFGQRWECWAQGHSQSRFSELGVPGPLAGVIPRTQSFLSTPASWLTSASPFCAFPQHTTAHHQASAPRSAAAPLSRPPRPPKCPSLGPSASSPSTSPSPRPSVRKAKAALAVSPCEYTACCRPAFGLP